MKKHGFLWWLLIGWWWRLYMIPFRVIKALIKRSKAPDETEESGLLQICTSCVAV